MRKVQHGAAEASRYKATVVARLTNMLSLPGCRCTQRSHLCVESHALNVKRDSCNGLYVTLNAATGVWVHPCPHLPSCLLPKQPQPAMSRSGRPHQAAWAPPTGGSEDARSHPVTPS